jgi:hypothetical protein
LVTPGRRLDLIGMPTNVIISVSSPIRRKNKVIFSEGAGEP